jgi:branched-subunit amino acid transport protein
MLSDLQSWALIAGLAVVAFVSRAAFILPGSRLRLPATLEQILRYAPAAALVAIIVPDLFRIDGQVQLGLMSPRLAAAVAGLSVAALTRNILLTIATGMLVLHVWSWLLP